MTMSREGHQSWEQAYSQAPVRLHSQPTGLALSHPDVRPGGCQLEREKKQACPSNSIAEASDTPRGRDTQERGKGVN